MTEPTKYEAPTVSTIGTLHELTKQTKTFGFADGILLAIPNTDVVIAIGSS